VRAGCFDRRASVRLHVPQDAIHARAEAAAAKLQSSLVAMMQGIELLTRHASAQEVINRSAQDYFDQLGWNRQSGPNEGLNGSSHYFANENGHANAETSDDLGKHWDKCDRQ
jgi:hypothetical protein